MENKYEKVEKHSDLPLANTKKGLRYKVLKASGSKLLSMLPSHRHYESGVYYSDGKQWLYMIF